MHASEPAIHGALDPAALTSREVRFDDDALGGSTWRVDLARMP